MNRADIVRCILTHRAKVNGLLSYLREVDEVIYSSMTRMCQVIDDLPSGGVFDSFTNRLVALIDRREDLHTAYNDIQRVLSCELKLQSDVDFLSSRKDILSGLLAFRGVLKYKGCESEMESVCSFIAISVWGVDPSREVTRNERTYTTVFLCRRLLEGDISRGKNQGRVGKRNSLPICSKSTQVPAPKPRPR